MAPFFADAQVYQHTIAGYIVETLNRSDVIDYLVYLQLQHSKKRFNALTT